jgi:hypothetical protein
MAGKVLRCAAPVAGVFKGANGSLNMIFLSPLNRRLRLIPHSSDEVRLASHLRLKSGQMTSIVRSDQFRFSLLQRRHSLTEG